MQPGGKKTIYGWKQTKFHGNASVIRMKATTSFPVLNDNKRRFV